VDNVTHVSFPGQRKSFLFVSTIELLQHINKMNIQFNVKEYLKKLKL